jgi:3-dehydroquinate synthase
MPGSGGDQHGIPGSDLLPDPVDFHPSLSLEDVVELLAVAVVVAFGGGSRGDGGLREALSAHWRVGKVEQAADGRSVLGGEGCLPVAVADFHGGSRIGTYLRGIKEDPWWTSRGLISKLRGVAEVRVSLGERSYRVVVESGLLGRAGAFLGSAGVPAGPVAVISDETVATLHAGVLMDSLARAGFDCTLHTVAAGESSKSLSDAETLCRGMVRGGHDRKSLVVALGGGVIGDLAGFVASVFLRGVPVVQVPTTLLAQVDSSVGGKTGVNLAEGKNLVGTFHQPLAVLVDPETLRSLPDREFRNGFAEVVKHAAIRDAAMLEDLARLDPSGRGISVDLVARNIAIKARIVEGDERETGGERALLNFGHTVGHAIEAAASYGVMLHGEAVSLGMRAALRISRRFAGLSEAGERQVLDLLGRFGLPLVLSSAVGTQEVMARLAADKKFERGAIRFVALEAPGRAVLVADVTEEDIRREVEALRLAP